MEPVIQHYHPGPHEDLAKAALNLAMARGKFAHVDMPEAVLDAAVIALAERLKRMAVSDGK